MAKSERTVTPSVLDRLLDYDHRASRDAVLTREESIRQYRYGVLRDVEWLLNSRRTIEEAPDILPEVQRSVYHYGVPDISSLSRSASDLQHMRTRVERSLRLFEPRLYDIRVTDSSSQSGGRFTLRFTIEGTLAMDPTPERIVFDTVVDGANREFQVKAHDDAG